MDDRYQNNDNHNTRLTVLLLLLTALVIAGGIYFGRSVLRNIQERRTASLTETETESEYPTEGSEAATEEDTQNGAETEGSTSPGTADVVEVVKKAMPSVVAITNKSVQEVTGMFRGSMEVESVSSGSGIIIGQNDTELLVATNYHVVQGASDLSVCFSVDTSAEEDTIVGAVVKGSDEEYDLAVVAVMLEDISEEVQAAIGIAQLGSSDELVIGEPAIAIGNALGYGQSVTSGIISALNRSLEIDGVTRTYIQTDAAINAGNSGGALLNAEGEVIGINSAKVSSSGVEGMGYAVPIDVAKPVLSALMERETRVKADEDERGYLGVYTQDVSEETRSLYDIPNGIYVTYVAGDSPAEDAGMQQGDIIREMDGVTISSTEGFEELLEYYRAGETVSIVILRANRGDYTSRTISVTFSAQPEEDGSGRGDMQPFGSWSPFN